jgi:hypothetical protein
MYVIKALVLGSMLAVSSLAVAPAFAYKFSPANTTFTATGQTNLSASGISVPCNATFVIVSDAAGNGSVTHASFSGSSFLCGQITAASLPWPTSATSLSGVTINNVKVTAPLGITCGAGPVAGTLSSSVFSFNTALNPGNCSISGSLTVSPALSITN